KAQLKRKTARKLVAIRNALKTPRRGLGAAVTGQFESQFHDVAQIKAVNCQNMGSNLAFCLLYLPPCPRFSHTARVMYSRNSAACNQNGAWKANLDCSQNSGLKRQTGPSPAARHNWAEIQPLVPINEGKIHPSS